MSHKVATCSKLFSLCLGLSFNSFAEEQGTVLFDTEQGIDETQDPIVKEIKDLTKSLDESNAAKQAPTDDQDQVKDTNVEDTEKESSDEATDNRQTPQQHYETQKIDPSPESQITDTDTESEANTLQTEDEGTVLIDTEQGIDETSSPAVKELENVQKSFEEIGLPVKNKPEPTDPGLTSEPDIASDPVITEPVTDSEKNATKQPAKDMTENDEPVESSSGEELTIEKEEDVAKPDNEIVQPAPDNNVLIDTEKGIDETVNPAIKEIQDITKQFEASGITPAKEQVTDDEKQGIEADTVSQPVATPGDEIQDVTPAEVATPADLPVAEPVTETEQLSTDTQETIEDKSITDGSTTPSIENGLLPPAPEGTVLIDIEQGIDETQDPSIKELDEITQSIEEEVEVAEDVKPVEDETEKDTSTVSTPTPQPASTPAPLPTTVTKTEIKQQPVALGPWIPKTDDLRILEIRVGNYWFDEVVDAYQYEDVILLPLGLICDLLDIAIDVGPDFASGFILKENNTFALDVKRKQVIINGNAEEYDDALVKTLNADIYIESRLLGKWLNMKFDIDLYASRVYVKSDIKLPFIARIEREKRIEATLSRLNNITEENYPRHYEPYRLFTKPFIDQTLRLGQRMSDKGNTTTYQYITHATADMFKHESSWYLSGDDQETVRDFRATFGRTDPDGELLGILNANEYTFGHVVESRVDLISVPGQLEPGVTVSNFPVGRQVEYDRHRFIGELLPGWEVELYRNNALIGYQQTPVEGQYDFQDIPLLFGNNHFRLVFYGQKGEIREENIHFTLTQALTRKGEHYYRASSTTDDIGSNRTSLRYDYGISKNISSSFNLVSLPLKNGTEVVQHNYLKAGLLGFWDALFANINLIDDSEGGSAFKIDLQTRAGETVIGLEDTTFDQFFSEEFLPTATELEHRSKISIDTAIPPTFLPRIPFSISYKTDEFANGTKQVEIMNQVSVSARGFAISNQLTSQKTTNQAELQSGVLQASTNVKEIKLRGIASYNLKPENELTNLGLTIDPGQYEDYRFSYGINHSLQQDLTEYSVTANKLSGNYNLSFGARYNTDGDINLDLSFSVGFGYEPRRQRWEQEARTLANEGSVSARVFLDKNQDGLFGEDDTPLESVGFRINGGYNKQRTDNEGISFLTGITAHQPTNIVLAPETMVDPLWKTAIDGVRIVPRPGHAIQLDFPIFMSGEADGTVYLSKNGVLQGVGRVTVELIDDLGQVINTTETTYDGFYVMPSIPVGKYWLRISRQQVEGLGVKLPGDQPIVITNDEPFVNGIDFTLKTY